MLMTSPNGQIHPNELLGLIGSHKSIHDGWKTRCLLRMAWTWMA